MLVKIIFDNKNFLISIKEPSFSELCEKIKKVCNIIGQLDIEFSNCAVDETVFEEIVEEFGKKKELIAFSVSKQVVSNDTIEYSSVEYLESSSSSVTSEVHERELNVIDSSHKESPRPNKRHLSVHPQISNINLKDIFEMKKCIGQMSSGQPLEKSDRVSLSKAVIKKVLEVCGLEYMIQRADFEYLSDKLQALINDPNSVYYIGALGGCPARGMLLHEYYAERTNLAKKSLIARRPKIRKEAIEYASTAAGNSEYKEVVSQFEGLEDWMDIKELWTSTRTARLSMWRSKTSGLSTLDIFDNFPFLTDTNSDELILEDFVHLYPNAIDSFNKWKNGDYKRVLNESRRFRDDCSKAIIYVIDQKEQENVKMMWTLALIPYIIAPNGRKLSSGESATKSNIQELFINIFRDLESYQADSNGEGEELVLSLVSDYGDIYIASYSILNYIYKYTDPETAFLSLFAKILVLDLKYPKVCSHVWQFVQRGVFGIEVDKRVMCHPTQEVLKVTNFI